jgi:peptidoglycan/xylan/chitin deacetylase (PgdA/CDA1 family)
MHPVSLLFHDVFAGDPRESGFASAAAHRYKLTVTAFHAQLACLAQEGADPFLLTFDDGGVSFYTIVADRLEAHGMRAHCFVTTGCLGRQGFLTATQLRELDGRGHRIGTHSVSHPARFSALSAGEMRREWTDSRRALEDVLGHEVTAGSVPGGYFSRQVASSAAECGLQLLFTSEPSRSVWRIDGCEVAGRFTIRAGARTDFSRKLVRRAPWTRTREWAAWNAKGLVKPLLGSSYPRVADWIHGGAR